MCSFYVELRAIFLIVSLEMFVYYVHIKKGIYRQNYIPHSTAAFRKISIHSLKRLNINHCLDSCHISQLVVGKDLQDIASRLQSCEGHTTRRTCDNSTEAHYDVYNTKVKVFLILCSQSLQSFLFSYLRKHLTPVTGLVVTNSASTEFLVTRGEPPVRTTSSGGTLADTEKITVKLQLYCGNNQSCW